MIEGRRLLALVLGGTLGMAAQAAVIDFNEFAWSAPAGPPAIGGEFSSGGYDFRAVYALVGNPLAQFRVVERTDPWQADPGFATIVMTDYPVNVVIERTGGGAFDFNSIDLADSANFGVARKVRLTFEYAGGGSSVQDVVLDTAPGLQTAAFAQSNVSRLTVRGVEQFVGEFPWYQFDNLSVTAVVPEPASTALLALGLVGIGAMRRRRS